MSQFNSIFSPLTNKLARLAGITLLAVAALFASTQNVAAQGTSTCVTSLEVRVGDACKATINATMVMLGSQPAGGVRVKINDLNPANDSIVDGVSPASGWAYGVYAITGGALLCQGVIYAVDYTAPEVTTQLADHDELTCDDIPNVLNVSTTWGSSSSNKKNRYYTGVPVFSDNCNGLVQLKVTDRIDYTDCESNGIMAIITRRFQAIDQYGNDTTVTQYIKFKRPQTSELTVIAGGDAKTTLTVSTAAGASLAVPVYATNGSTSPSSGAYIASTGFGPGQANMIQINHCSDTTSSSYADVVPTGTADQKREKLRQYLQSLHTYRYRNSRSTATQSVDGYNGTVDTRDLVGGVDSISFFRPKTPTPGLSPLCNFSWDFTYTEFDNCNNGKKFMVEASIVDWCTNTTTKSYVVFAFEDKTAPKFSAFKSDIPQGNADGAIITDTVDISVGTNDCTASLRLSGNSSTIPGTDLRDLANIFNVKVSDLCGTITLNYTVETKDYYNQNYLVQQNWTVTPYTRINSTVLGSPAVNIIGIPIGSHRLKVVAHDACNNKDSITLVFRVVDKVAPVMICDDEVTVTLTGNGTTNYFFSQPNPTNDLDLPAAMQSRLTLSALNEGSRDNCTLDSMFVRRKFSYSSTSPNDGIFKYLRTNTDYDSYSASGTSNGTVEITDFEQVKDGSGNLVSGMYYTPKYMQYVDVFCGEPNGEVMYELWGADANHYNGPATGSTNHNRPVGGNWSYCWGTITVEDKSNPSINRPNLAKTYNNAAVNYINCTEKEWIQGGDLAKINVKDLAVSNNRENTTSGRIATVAAANEKFGIPDIYGVECSGDVYYSVIKKLTCDTGVILRIWSVEKKVKDQIQVRADTQLIWVQASHDYYITVPQDRVGDCLDATVINPTDKPTWDEDGCDLLAMSAANQTVYDATEPADNACKKIYRTWTIINWCQVPNQFSCASADPMNYARIIPRLAARTGTGSITSSLDDPYVYPRASATLAAVSQTHRFVKNNTSGGVTGSGDRDKGQGSLKYAQWLGPKNLDVAATGSNWSTKALSGSGRMGLRKYVSSTLSSASTNSTNISTWNGGTASPAVFDTDYPRANFPSAGDCALAGEQTFAWQYTQVIKINDTSKPYVKTQTDTGLKLIEGDDGNTDDVVWDATRKVFGVRGNDAKTTGITGNECKALVEFSFEITDACTQSGPFTVDATAQVVTRVPAGQTMNTSGTAVTIEAEDPSTAGSPIFKIKDNTLNLDTGSYELIVDVRDDCGNFYRDRIPFDVRDIKAPAPVCVQYLTVSLMPTNTGGPNNAGMVVVKAQDVFQNIERDWREDECGGAVTARIGRVGGTLGTDGVPANDTIHVTCKDYPNGVIANVYLKDAAGNVGYCQVNIRVEDNNNICTSTPGSAAVAGAIQTETKATVEGVQVNLSGQSQKSFATGVNGLFVFNNLTAGADYTVTPSLNKGFLNGVSTFDLVLISKHILGVQPLNTPYKLIAADVNNSKSVTTLDLIQLRKLILNIDASFANNSSWRFVDASYTFPNASNPWAASFPEVKNVNDLVGSLTANFVAIKVGDVNGNAIANSTQGSVRNLTSNLGINVADMNLVAGNEYKVDFTAADLNGVEGFQFTLNLDKKGLELVDLVPGIAAEENFGIFAEEGVVTASWNGEAKGGVLFSLVVRAKSNTTLSEVLNLNSRYTAAEAYKGGEVMNVGLNFNAVKASANYELYQNTPNPFAGETVIGFNLPVAGQATLTIQDVTGRTLKVINGQYAKGYNQVNLKSTELTATGVLTYTLKAADFTATRKMIIVE